MWFSVQTKAIPLLLSLVSLAIDFYTLKSEGDQTEYTALEEKLLGEIRLLAKDELTFDYERTDEFLIRWIRECKLDVNGAFEMIHTMKQWRKQNRVDSILNETLTEMMPCNIDTMDNNGYPVLICELAGVDLRKLLLTGHKHSFIRFTVQWVEKHMSAAREIARKAGKCHYRTILIFNGQGFSVKQHGCFACLDLIRDLIRISRAYYPQSLERIIVVNAPAASMPIARIVTPVLPEYYQKTLRIFGTDQEEWSKFLLSIIPPHELGKRYGGTKVT